MLCGKVNSGCPARTPVVEVILDIIKLGRENVATEAVATTKRGTVYQLLQNLMTKVTAETN